MRLLRAIGLTLILVVASLGCREESVQRPGAQTGVAHGALTTPILSAERGTDSPILGNAPSYQYRPAIALGGSRLLTVWEDIRGSSDPDYDIYGARIDAVTGALLDPAGIPLSTEPGEQRRPAVASDGTNFFVCWHEARTDGAGSDLFGVQVNAATGAISSPRGELLAGGGNDQQSCAVAFDGSRYVVAYQERDINGISDLFAVYVTIDGKLVPGDPVTVSAAANNQYSPRISAFGNGGALVVWNDTRLDMADVYAARIDPNGVVLDPDGLLIAAGQGFQQAGDPAWSGSEALIVWQDIKVINTQNTYDLHGAFLFPDGGINAGDGGIVISNRPGSQVRPIVIHSGTNFIVTWYEFQTSALTDVFGARVKSDGTVIDPTGFLITDAGGLQTEQDVALAANGLFVVWQDSRGGVSRWYEDIYGRKVTMSGTPTPLPELNISASANSQGTASVAWTGSSFDLTWGDFRQPALSDDIYRLRVGPEGGPLGPVTQVDSSPDIQTPGGIAVSTTQSLVAWRGRDVSIPVYYVGARFHPLDGGAPGSTFHVRAIDGGAIGGVAVASDGENFLVAWEELISVTTRIRSARVFADGGMPDVDAGQIGGGPGIQRIPRLGFDGDRYVAVFEAAAGVPTNIDIQAAFIDPASGIPGPAFPVSARAGDERFPRLSFDDTSTWVIWQDARNLPLGMGQDLYGSRLHADGGVLDSDGVPLISKPADQVFPAVAFDGRHHVLAWQDSRDPLQPGVFVAFMRPDGTIAPFDGGTELSVGATPFATKAPQISSDGEGRTLLAYTVMDETLGVNANRLRWRTLRLNQFLGEACSEAADCISGFCADGVCCDSACGSPTMADCLACSVAAGAAIDGRCATQAANTVCRAPAGGCDRAEVCDGAATACPPDVLVAANEECRPALLGCDVPEVCSGDGAMCPVDQLRPAEFVCREAISSCDEAERCAGDSPSCPEDVTKPDGAECPEGVCIAAACEDTKSHYALASCSSAGGSMIPLALAFVLLVVLSRRRRVRNLAAFLGVLMLPGVARAQVPAEPARQKLSFMGVTAAQPQHEGAAAAVSDLIQSELAALGPYDVLGAKEVAAIIGLERQKALLGCAENSSAECLAEIAGAMDANRAVSGTLASTAGGVVLTLSLLDPKLGKSLGRVTRRVNAVDAALEASSGMAHELALQDPALVGRKLNYQRAFGGIVAGVRGELDVAGRGLAAGVTGEVSGRRFGGALTILMGASVGIRGEARYFPLELKTIRPYVAAGATLFAPAVGARLGVGTHVMVGDVVLSGDAAYERFFNDRLTFIPDAVLVSVGAGWHF